MSFDQFGLAEPITRAVAGQGYAIPTPIQTQAIPHVLSGSDVLGCAQTGTGKTAAFALPILHRLSQSSNPPPHVVRRVRVLVLAPTRELASQIGQSFRTYGKHTGLKQTVIYGGVGQQPQVKDLKRGVDILIATPGRLLDLMNQGFVDLRSVEIFVLDEADRMLDMGFLPDLRRVIARLPTKRQTVFFSATMPGPIAELAAQILKQPVQVRIAPVKVTTELIEQSVCFVAKPHKPKLLAAFLNAEGQQVTRAIVFTRTKHGADRLTKHLARVGIQAEAMHGDKSQGARQRALANFKSSHTRILVATDLAARGIDVEGISHIFNYDLPHDGETYVHRIGRTGRAGAKGTAISFCSDEERDTLRAIERLLKKPLAVDKETPAGVSIAAPTPVVHAQSGQPPHTAGKARTNRVDHWRPKQGRSSSGQPRRKRRGAAMGR